jgi:hypothetical protein
MWRWEDVIYIDDKPAPSSGALATAFPSKTDGTSILQCREQAWPPLASVIRQQQSRSEVNRLFETLSLHSVIQRCEEPIAWGSNIYYMRIGVMNFADLKPKLERE